MPARTRVPYRPDGRTDRPTDRPTRRPWPGRACPVVCIARATVDACRAARDRRPAGRATSSPMQSPPYLTAPAAMDLTPYCSYNRTMAEYFHSCKSESTHARTHARTHPAPPYQRTCLSPSPPHTYRVCRARCTRAAITGRDHGIIIIIIKDIYIAQVRIRATNVLGRQRWQYGYVTVYFSIAMLLTNILSRQLKQKFLQLSSESLLRDVT